MATKQSSTTKRFNRKFHTSVGDQLNSPEQIRKSRQTLATGGGQPIKKGGKWTNEKRVLQPRDEEGHFDYNSSAGYERKYDYHAERNGSHNGEGGGGKYKTLPTYARDNFDLEKCIRKGVRKGDFISMSDSNVKIIANCDLTGEEFQKMLEESMGVTDKTKGGTNVSTGDFVENQGVKKGSATRANELDDDNKFSTVSLRGKQGEKVKTGANVNDIKTKMTPQGIAYALKKKLSSPLKRADYDKYGPEGALISPAKLAMNQAHNEALGNEKVKAAPEPQHPQERKWEPKPQKTNDKGYIDNQVDDDDELARNQALEAMLADLM
jgi:hypothetical protein